MLPTKRRIIYSAEEDATIQLNYFTGGGRNKVELDCLVRIGGVYERP